MDVMAGPTREFWDKRFQSGETPWDRGDTNPHGGGGWVMEEGTDEGKAE